MKFKFVAIFSIIILCFVNSFAQERNIEIEISMEDNVIEQNAKEIPVEIKITNNAEDDISTERINNLYLQFSECLVRNECLRSGKTHVSRVMIPKKVLRQYQSLEFKADLLELFWVIPNSIPPRVIGLRNFKDAIPKESIYFQAFISLPAGYEKDNTLKLLIPKKKVFNSNTIVVVID